MKWTNFHHTQSFQLMCKQHNCLLFFWIIENWSGSSLTHWTFLTISLNTLTTSWVQKQASPRTYKHYRKSTLQNRSVPVKWYFAGNISPFSFAAWYLLAVMKHELVCVWQGLIYVHPAPDEDVPPSFLRHKQGTVTSKLQKPFQETPIFTDAVKNCRP